MAVWANMVKSRTFKLLVAFVLLCSQEILCYDSEGGDVQEVKNDVEALRLQLDSLRTLYGADIQFLKKDLRSEKAHRSNLEEKLDRVMQGSGCSQRNSDCKDVTAKITLLQEALKLEKERNTEMKSELYQLKSELSVLKASSITEKVFESVVNNITIRQDTCQKDVVETKYNIENLACSIDIKMDKRTKSSKDFTPTFVSDWIMMESQDNQKSSATIHHGLGHYPRKVDIQVQPVSGANKGWIFPGSGATQIDDDYDSPYGGVIYAYNQTTILLATPKKGNGVSTGTIVDTGKDSNWLGDNHQRSAVAYIRARVWGEDDLPAPDFTSQWINISLKDNATSFLDIQHHLGVYPDLVTAQIKLGTSGYISDGIGSSMFCVWPGPGCGVYGYWGGVIYAFNDKTIRLWVPYVTYSRHVGHLGFGGDGWNLGIAPKSGQVRVLAWKMPSSDSYETETIKTSKTQTEIYFSRSLDIDKDYISVYAEASDGPNKSYRFKSWGGAQNPVNRATFGGVISAYSAVGGVRIWRPDVNHKGTLINIKAPYGRNESLQASDEGYIVATVFKPKCMK